MAVSIAFINNSVLHSSGNLLLYSSIDSSTISGDQVYMYIFNVLTGISFETMQRLPDLDTAGHAIADQFEIGVVKWPS